MKEAMFYQKIGENIKCVLCPRNCVISEGNKGFCGVRENINGKLFSSVFGKPCSLAIDPIEKKPFFHFAPGSETLSIATVGCNFRCSFCQNYEISQPSEIFGDSATPEELISMNKTQGFSWTYTEPTVFYEYFFETAKLCKNKKIDKYHTWVSNGYTNVEPIKKISRYLNAVNIDYKGNEYTYRSLCSSSLEPVQTSLVEYKKLGIWIEITNLLIPKHNDKDEQIKEMVEWILDNLGQVPLHFSRFFPMHKLNGEITPEKTLEKAANIAENMGLEYVYVGNIRNEKENTYCHNCKHLLIKRQGFSIVKTDIKKKGRDFHCPECTTKIPLAGMKWSKIIEKS